MCGEGGAGGGEARGPPAQLPAAAASPHFKEPTRQELHSRARAGCPSPGPPSPVPSGPLYQAPLSPSTHLLPSPSTARGASSPGRGPPHRSTGRGPRAGLGAGAPPPLHRGGTLAHSEPPLIPPGPPGGCVPEVGAAGGRGGARAPGPGPLPSARRMVGSTESAGRRAVSSERSRRRGLGDRGPSSRSRSSSSRPPPRAASRPPRLGLEAPLSFLRRRSRRCRCLGPGRGGSRAAGGPNR